MDIADDLTLDLLPAGDGDALLLSWGPVTERRRMLIDGGRRTPTTTSPGDCSFCWPATRWTSSC
jgi:hypothetical protein